MSPFVVSPATAADLESLAIVSRAAFRASTQSMSYWVFPQENEEGIYQWRLRYITNIFHNDPTCSYFKCVDNATGKIVAFACWESPHPPKIEEQSTNEQQDKKEGTGEDALLPEGTNTRLMHEFKAETQRTRDRYVNSEEDYDNEVLRGIATLPEYQGRGCASALLKAGLEKVDAEGRKAFLEATPQGHPLYLKFGWRDVDQMEFDLNKYGFDGRGHVQMTACMMRDATKQAK